MAKELVVRGGALKKAAKKGALKKAAKKVPAKKTPGKKAAKKVPGKKAAGKKAAKKIAMKFTGNDFRAFHHLQRASAVISLLDKDTGGDLRMLLELGVARYRDGEPGAADLLRAVEHLAMAGLYAARKMHRLDVVDPQVDDVERLIEVVGEKIEGLEESDEEGFAGRLPALTAELLGRAEAAVDHDLHMAWELAMAADGLCEGLAS